MTRGNQRDKAREKAAAKLAGLKSGNSKSGSEMQRDKENVAAKMREKQAAVFVSADARKAAEGVGGGKK
ncbi:putative serf family protein [Glarea lozoyensis ATCC 20868]|uniref:Putative serf family protein n=1 Tax=Glarea lozoyensis (strain ATCC 20868 / MF5171) TaxID=1116229 RepID=S3ECB2_GLAL2|nr:putative serf family protein [Glarea lozoyensis ATCC 20868]EPE35948.1 putative serf family protein [Glarea lozoyensis ATCC 20868]